MRCALHDGRIIDAVEKPDLLDEAGVLKIDLPPGRILEIGMEVEAAGQDTTDAARRVRFDVRAGRPL